MPGANPPPAVPQAITAPLTRSAIFLVVTVAPDPAAEAAARGFCPGLSGLVRSVGSRDADQRLSCIMGIGSAAWDRLFGTPKPANLHPFKEIVAGPRHAVSTPGDLLFHIRAERMDMCFELATVIMAKLGEAVSIEDEVHGFRYFDARDVLGFVDGTENPDGDPAWDATTIGAEDPDFAGGSYVIVQKYLHDMTAWNALPTEVQERIIGRTKLSNIELDDAVKPTSAHNALTQVEKNGEQVQILRDNMAFGQPGHGEFGTYFIGYSRSPATTEEMLENMFVGKPPGNYDRLLDFSKAVTGNLFFVPSGTFLDGVTSDPVPPAAPAPPDNPPTPDGSLGIGSLKGEPSV